MVTGELDLGQAARILAAVATESIPVALLDRTDVDAEWY